MAKINCPASIVSAIFRCSDRGREIVAVCVEAVLSGREIVRRVLNADFDEERGLITCERALLIHSANEGTSLRSDAGGHTHSRG